MQRVVEADPKKVGHLIHAAYYNVGRAYLQGYGCKQSDELAEK
jgi:TPR repeat protein